MLLLGVALLGACGDDTATTTAGADGPADAAVDPELFTVHPVLREASPPCDDVAVDGAAGEVVVGAPSGDAAPSCLVLGPAIIDATDIATAELSPMRGPDRFGVFIELAADAVPTLDAFSAQHLGERAAMLLRGRLVGAPVIEAPEFAGRIAAVDLSREEAIELVTAVGGDPTMPPPDADAAMGERAQAVCDAFLPPGGDGATASIAIVESAGSITASLGDAAIEPWRSLPADHFVAGCGYALPSVGAPSTTICPNGEMVSLERPSQFFVDEEGRSTEAPPLGGPEAPLCRP